LYNYQNEAIPIKLFDDNGNPIKDLEEAALKAVGELTPEEKAQVAGFQGERLSMQSINQRELEINEREIELDNAENSRVDRNRLKKDREQLEMDKRLLVMDIEQLKIDAEFKKVAA
jgi:hypothetical protein